MVTILGRSFAAARAGLGNSFLDCHHRRLAKAALQPRTKVRRPGPFCASFSLVPKSNIDVPLVWPLQHPVKVRVGYGSRVSGYFGNKVHTFPCTYFLG